MWKVPLKGTFIHLDPIRADDFEALYDAAKDPLIWEQHPEYVRYQREVFEKYFASALRADGAFIIRYALTNEVIGSSRFYDYTADKSFIKIGYTFLKRSYWGGKVNGELKTLMIAHAKKYVSKVLFEVGAKNIRSQRALEKIGAKRIDKPTNELSVTLDEKIKEQFTYEIDTKDYI